MKAQLKNHFIWLAVIILLCNIILHPLVIGNADTTYVSPDGNVYLVNLNGVWFPINHIHHGNHNANGGCYTQAVYHTHHNDGPYTYSFGDGTSYTESTCPSHEGDYYQHIGSGPIITSSCNKSSHKRPNPNYGKPGYEGEGPYYFCGGTLTEQTFTWKCSECGDITHSTYHHCGRTGENWDTFESRCHCKRIIYDCNKDGSIVGWCRNCGKETTTVIAQANVRLNEDTGNMEYSISSDHVNAAGITYTIKEMTMDENLLNTYTLSSTNQGTNYLSVLGINQPKYNVTINFTERDGAPHTVTVIPTYVASIFNLRYQSETQKPLNVYLDGTKLRAVYYCNDGNLPEMFNKNRDYLMFGY